MSFILFFHRLADRDLWSSHEARAAMDAQSILDDNAWEVPHLYDGRPELQKPPLYYWLVALFARIRGGEVDAWAVRLPAALSALGCVMVILCFLWRIGRPIAGIIAAIVLATAIHFTWLARVGRIDMPLTLAVSVCLCGLYPLVPKRGLGKLHSYSFPNSVWERWRARLRFGSAPRLETEFRDMRSQTEFGNERQWGQVFAYLALAAGLLLKGPIALVLPGAALGLFLLLKGQRRHPLAIVHRLGVWWGVPLAVGIAAFWFVPANRASGNELFRTFFLHHNLDRAFGENIVGRWAHPWWLYGPLFAANFLPWSVLIPVAAWLTWHNGWWREDRELRFGAVWFIGMLAVLSSVSFKRADYLLPAYPGTALFLGCVGERFFRAASQRTRLAASFAVVALGCVVGWLVYLHAILPQKDQQLEYRSFAAEVRRWAPAPERVSFFRMEAHTLAFHVGRPLDIFVEWEKLTEQAARPEPQYVVMPLARFDECTEHVLVERIEKLRTSAHAKPLVLLRTRPPATVARADKPADAGSAAIAADRHAATHCPAARSERPAGP